VGRVDGDAALLFLRCVVDGVEAARLAQALVGQHGGDGGGEGGLAVVNVADGADVDVRLGPLKVSFAMVVRSLGCSLSVGPSPFCVQAGPLLQPNPFLFWSL
jgi:hypothetical protein